MNSISTLLDFYLFYVYFLEKKKKQLKDFSVQFSISGIQCLSKLSAAVFFFILISTLVLMEKL